MKKLKPYYWKWYFSIDGDYRVNCHAGNGRLLFASCEGYSTRRGAINNAALFGAPASLLWKAQEEQEVEQLR